MKLVISATNLVNGGPFTIIKQCLDSIDASLDNNDYKISVVAFINSKEIFPKYKHVHLIELSSAKKSWLRRIWYEYFVFNKISKKMRPDIWLSLHDMSPRVKADVQAVYMHNPTMFATTKISDFFYDRTFFLWVNLYKYVYKINIHSNNFLIVQQQWLRNEFSNIFNFDKKKIIVFPPEIVEKTSVVNVNQNLYDKKVFIYASYPRSFKNFEIICEATCKLVGEGVKDFIVRLTIDGSENRYTRKIVDRYKSMEQIEFCGVLPYNEMDDFYQNSSCLIFPSKLETFGLPIIEYGAYNKPMIISDLPYAHETSSGLKNVAYFQPNDSNMLAKLMKDHINDDYSSFRNISSILYDNPFIDKWEKLIKLLIDEKNKLSSDNAMNV